MGLDTKLNLNDNLVEQIPSDELSLSGQTNIYGIINSIEGYWVGDSGVTITNLNGDIIFKDVSVTGVTLSGLSLGVNVIFTMAAACSDITSDLAAGNDKAVFFVPVDMKLIEVFAALGTPPSGSTFVTDVNLNGTTIFSGSSKVNIESGENTSLTALSQPIIETSDLPKGGKITVDFDSVGAINTGKAHTIYLRGKIN